jgi:hypothetical protein
MKELGTKQDWLVANMMSPESTFADFEQQGLNNSNIELLDRDSYKKNDKVKQAFTNVDGKFEEEKYDQFYDVVAQTYNTFSTRNYDKTLLNDDYFAKENIFVSDNVKRLEKPYTFSKEKNPFGSKQGIRGPLSKTESDLTIREIAQTQKVFDFEKGEFKEFSANDLGFLGTMFGKNTAILAQYDEDGVHYDADLGKELTHYKGEYKFNEEGKPFYETLAGREVYGKQVLSPWDVLTVDGTAADKWNFMSGDDKRKSILGNITRAAAYAAPYFIPGVGQYYTLATIGSALLTDVVPVLTKAGLGIFLNDTFGDTEFTKALNELEGYGRRFQPSQSDESSKTILNWDNISVMMADVFGQLAQQRGIAKIPGWLGLKQKEAQAFSMAMKGKNAEQITELSAQYKKIKDPILKSKFLNENFGRDKEIGEMLRKWDLWNSEWSRNLGITYMAAISSTPIYEESKLNGLSDRESGLMFLATVGSLGALMQNNLISNWAIQGIGLDEASIFAKETVRKAVKETTHLPTGVMSLEDLAKTTIGTIANVGEEAISKPATLFRRMTDSLTNQWRRTINGPFNSVVSKGIAESVEEMSEEALTDSLKLGYNLFNAIGIKSEQAKPFQFDDNFSRYALAALGGFAGGAVVGVQDMIGGRAYSSLPDKMKSEFVSMLVHGYENDLREALEEQHKKGLLGSTTLSPIKEDVKFKLGEDTVYKSKEAGKISQNDFIYGILNSQIDYLKKVIFQEGGMNLNYSMNYDQREKNLIELQYTTPIQNDINDIIKQIADIKSKMSSEGGVKEATEAEAKANKEADAGLESELKPLQKRLEGILNGDYRLEYTEKGLFATNPLIYSAYGIKDANTLAQELFNKNYNSLNDEQKKEVNSALDLYDKSEKRVQLVKNFSLFKKDTELTNAYVEKLNKYALQKKAIIEGFYNPQIVLGKLKLLGKEESLDQIGIDTSKNVSLMVQDDLANEKRVLENEDGTVEIDQIQLLRDYIEFAKKEEYLNPLLDNFIKMRFDIPYAFNMSYVNLLNENSPEKKIKSVEEYFRLMQAIPLSYFNFNNDILGQKFQNLDLRLSNLEQFKEKLRLGVEGFITDPDEMKSFTDGIKINPELIEDGEDGFLDPEGLKEVIDLINQELKMLADNLDYDNTTLFYGSGGLENTITSDTKEVGELSKMYVDYNNIVNSKQKSPIHELIAKFAELETETGVKYLFDSINQTFKELESNNFANQFIMSEGISKQQLEKALALVERIDASLHASANYSPINNIIGYNESLNRVETLGLPTMEASEYLFLKDELDMVRFKIEFLLNLSNYNSGGTIREQKQMAVRTITLYLDGLRGHLEPLKDLGLDINPVLDLFEASKVYSKNTTLIKNDDVPLYDDNNYTDLRIEEAKIRQSFYKIINTSDESIKIFNQYFSSLLNTPDGIKIDIDEQISPDLKVFSDYQNLMYLGKISSIDPKTFLKDYYGDLTKGDEFLKNQVFSPFYTQELVSELVYWSVFSKFQKNNTFDLFVNKVLPQGEVTEDKRKPNLENKERLVSLLSTVFVNGIPGAGKTSAVIKFMQNALSKYGLNTALYAPLQTQVNNLLSSVVNKDSVINKDNGLIIDLFNAINPELYSKIEEDIKTLNYKKKSELTDETLLYYMSVMQEGEKGKNKYDLTLNRNHKSVKKFMDEFKELKINGQIPSVIFIDEATNISSTHLQLLNLAINLHNENHEKSEDKISLVLVGDTEQSGYTAKLNMPFPLPLNVANNVNVIALPKLASSLRAGNNLIVENIAVLRSFYKTAMEELTNERNVLNNRMLLKYVEKEDGLFGHKIMEDFSEEYIIRQVRANLGNTVLITENLDSQVLKVLEKNFAEGDYKVMKPEDIQGSETDFLILDSKIDFNESLTPDNTGAFISGYTKLYTLLSRSKKGTLITKGSIPNKLLEVTTDNKDVLFKNIALDKNLLDKYKDFNEKSLIKIQESLEDIETGLVSSSGTNVKDPGLIEGEGMDLIFNAISNQLNDDPEHTGNIIVDEKGNVIEYDWENPIVYSYHEHLGFSTKKDGTLKKVEDPYIDVPLLYEDRFGSKLSAMTSKEDIDAVRKELKLIKTGLINYGMNRLNKGDSLMKYLRNDAKVNSAYFTSGSVLENIDDFEFLIKTKEFDPEFDTSYESKVSDAEQEGYISYLMAYDPNSWDDQINDYSIKITVAALPNVNNKKIPDKVKTSLKLLHEKHKGVIKKEKTDYSYIKVGDLSKVLQRISNVMLDKNKNYPTYSEFKSANSHFNMSDPLIVTDRQVLKLVESDDVESIKQLAEINKQGISTLNGKAVVFVSDDFSIKPEELPYEYVRQVKAAQDKNVKLEDRKNSVRMVYLNPNGLDFSTWMERNQEILMKIHNNPDLIKPSERKALTNNYAAAQMIARLMVISEQYHFNKKKVINDIWIPRDIVYTNGKLDKTKLDSFVKRIDQFLEIAIPAMFGKTYAEVIFDITRGKVKKDVKGGSEYTIDTSLLAEYFKESQNDSVSGKLNKLLTNKIFDRITNAAKEHALASDLYRLLEDTTITNVPFKIESFLESKSLPYEQMKEINDRSKLQRAMQNMVAAMRVAIYGGRLVTNRDNKEASRVIPSIFSDGVSNKFSDEKARAQFLKDLNMLFTYNESVLRPAVANDKYEYKVLFPDGIHLDIVAKSAGENFDPKTKPFVRPIETNYDYMNVNVGLSEPKYILNIEEVLKEEGKAGGSKLKINLDEYSDLLKQLQKDRENILEQLESNIFDLDKLSNNIQDYFDSLPAADIKEISKFMAKNKIYDMESLVVYLNDKLLNEVFNPAIVPNIYDQYVVLPGANISYELKSDTIKVENIFSHEEFVSLMKEKDPMINQIIEEYKGLNPNLPIYKEDYEATLGKFTITINNNPIIEFTADKDGVISSSKLFENQNNKKEILKLMDEIQKLTKNKVVNNFIEKLKGVQDRNNLLPSEQIEIAKDYLAVRLELRTAIDENLDQVEPLVQKLYKDLFTTKKC